MNTLPVETRGEILRRATREGYGRLSQVNREFANIGKYQLQERLRQNPVIFVNTVYYKNGEWSVDKYDNYGSFITAMNDLNEELMDANCQSIPEDITINNFEQHIRPLIVLSRCIINNQYGSAWTLVVINGKVYT